MYHWNNMKPQDILFLVVLVILLILRRPKLAVGVGLTSIIISMPLFAKHIFFTAEHLTWYAASFFLLAIILFLFQNKGKL